MYPPRAAGNPSSQLVSVPRRIRIYVTTSAPGLNRTPFRVIISHIVLRLGQSVYVHAIGMKIVILCTVVVCVFAHIYAKDDGDSNKTAVHKTRDKEEMFITRFGFKVPKRIVHMCSINCLHNSCNKTCYVGPSICRCNKDGYSECICVYLWPRKIPRHDCTVVGDHATPSSPSRCYTYCRYNSCSRECKEGRAICHCQTHSGYAICVCDSWWYKLDIRVRVVSRQISEAGGYFYAGYKGCDVTCKYTSCSKVCRSCTACYCEAFVFSVCRCCD